MKAVMLVSNSRKGENIFHCWNSSESFYVFTQRGSIGIENAFSQLKKAYGKIYMNITHCANKSEVMYYFK